MKLHIFAEASCGTCDWSPTGKISAVVEEAIAHVEATGHIYVDFTGTVEAHPDFTAEMVLRQAVK